MGTIERRPPARDNPGTEPADAGDTELSGSGYGAGTGDEDFLVHALMGTAAGWVIRRTLWPRSVSWPRVIVAGIGATVLAEVVGRALGPTDPDRDHAYDEDPDALLIRLGSGIALGAGYAAVLYPRLPGSPLTKGLILAAMEIGAAPHGGLVNVAADTPGLRFPLEDLAVPIDSDAGPLARAAFGVGLGLLYRPPRGDDDA